MVCMKTQINPGYHVKVGSAAGVAQAPRDRAWTTVSTTWVNKLRALCCISQQPPEADTIIFILQQPRWLTVTQLRRGLTRTQNQAIWQKSQLLQLEQ